VVRSSRPDSPTPKQVAELQRLINQRQSLRFRLVVQRAAVDVIGPLSTPNPAQAMRPHSRS
jgi:hypothetical protein